MESQDTKNDGFVTSAVRELVRQCVLWLPVVLLVVGILGGFGWLRLTGLVIGGTYVLLFVAWLIFILAKAPTEARRDWQHLGPLGRVIHGAGYSLVVAGVALCTYAGVALWTLTR